MTAGHPKGGWYVVSQEARREGHEGPPCAGQASGAYNMPWLPAPIGLLNKPNPKSVSKHLRFIVEPVAREVDFQRVFLR